MPLGTEVGIGQGHIVLGGDPDRPTERGTATFRRRAGSFRPHFAAHVYYGQMTGWIRIPLGKALGLG